MSTTVASITGGQVERHAPGDRFTLAVKSGQTVRGGRLVEITGDEECQEAGATSIKVSGVAIHDADPAGEWKKVGVAAEGIWNLVASGAINAGDQLITDTAGRVKTLPAVDATNVGTLGTGATQTHAIVGIAMAAIADTAAGPVKLRL